MDIPSQHNLSFLLQIFPDADPAFLECKADLIEPEIEEFISQALENKEYPKKEETELLLYTTDFNLEKFLKIFPDPFSYFLDEKRTCNNSFDALNFLKEKYRKHSIKKIDKIFCKFKYNLSKTCEFLDSALPTRSSKRPNSECSIEDTKDLEFLQEVCFIEHKREIHMNIEDKKEARRLAFEEAKSQADLIECGFCYQETMFEDCVTCNEGDIFCKQCVKKSVEGKIGDGFTKFPCLLDCGSEFSFMLLQDLLNARVFSRLLVRIQSDEVRAANIEGLEVCPFCEYAAIPTPEDQIFNCKNPDCLKESCRKCFKVKHNPLPCEEVETDDQVKARKYIEDEMTRALVRECYNCKKHFIKLDGCNKMVCSCGAIMCYICRQPVTDYSHFNDDDIGGSVTHKCPIYSSDKVLNVDIVKAMATEAMHKVKAQNPDMKLMYDPSKLLPTSPVQQKALPEGVVEQPVQLVQNMMQHLQATGSLDRERLPDIEEETEVKLEYDAAACPKYGN